MNKEIGEKILGATLGTLIVGGVLAGVIALSTNSEVDRVNRIRNSNLAAPLCPTLQGDDWRVISLGKNTLLTANIVEPRFLGFRFLGWPRWEEGRQAELRGLAEVLRRFEGKVLSVQDVAGISHIVTVTDDSCTEK